MYVCMYVCIYVCIYVCMCIKVFAPLHLCVFLSVCLSVCLCVCICVCVCVCVFQISINECCSVAVSLILEALPNDLKKEKSTTHNHLLCAMTQSLLGWQQVQ